MKTLWKTIPLALALGFAAAAQGAGTLIIIDFDDADKWTAGSGGITSYQSDHSYADHGFVFTGGPALRDPETAIVDGFSSALDVYGWRLRNAAVTWTATYTLALQAGESFGSFGFDARRWDDSPSPAYTVEYSFNGGTDWTVASSIGSSGVLDNAAFGDSSDWSTFEQLVTGPDGLAANQFVVRLSATTGERVMVDNFSYEVVPEPSTYAALAGLLALGLVIARRRRA